MPSIARLFSASLVGAFALAAGASAQDTKFVPFPSFKQTMIAGPECLGWREAWEGGWSACADDGHQAWLKDVSHWRDERRIRVGFDGARYDDPRFAWTRRSFMQAQMMVRGPLPLRSRRAAATRWTAISTT